jgi:hypothetical protein
MSFQEPHAEVCKRLAKWLPWKAMCWAWPVSFDMTFLRSYGASYCNSLFHAVHPARWMDCRSWISGRRCSLVSHDELDAVYESVKDDNVLHDGLSDALWQIRCLKAVDRLCVERSSQTLFPEASS